MTLMFMVSIVALTSVTAYKLTRAAAEASHARLEQRIAIADALRQDVDAVSSETNVYNTEVTVTDKKIAGLFVKAYLVEIKYEDLIATVYVGDTLYDSINPGDKVKCTVKDSENTQLYLSLVA